MSRYLVDKSVLQRLPRSTVVQGAMASLLDAEHELCACALSLDEFAYTRTISGRTRRGQSAA